MGQEEYEEWVGVVCAYLVNDNISAALWGSSEQLLQRPDHKSQIDLSRKYGMVLFISGAYGNAVKALAYAYLFIVTKPRQNC